MTGSGPVSADREGPPPDIDISVAHVARVYDYWLGGKDNFAADRAAAEAAMREDPNVVEGVRGNRAFLARAVRYLAGQAGVRQFLDIGTGIPAADNTHEDDPAGVIRQLMDAVPPGSYLAISHPANDINSPGVGRLASRLNELMPMKLRFRARAEVARFFDGLELVEPGLVRAPGWRPDSDADLANPAAVWAGVARKN